MAEAFIRKYELVLGTPTRLLKSAQTPQTATPAPGSLAVKDASDVVAGADSSRGYVDYCTAPSEALTFTELQMEAVIKYNTVSSGKQTATIKILNLSEQSRLFITADTSVILKAGYLKDELLPIVYVGQVISVETNLVGMDLVTTLVCSEAANILKNTTHIKTYDKGGTYLSIIEDLLKQFAGRGIPEGVDREWRQNERATKVFTKSISVKGNLSKTLVRICKNINFGWFISLGKITVRPIESGSFQDTIKIVPANVKGRIKQSDDKSTLGTFSSKTTQSGIKLSTYLNGNISTNTLLEVTFGDFQGTYRISSVTHRLNFRGDLWDTEVSCLRNE